MTNQILLNQIWAIILKFQNHIVNREEANQQLQECIKEYTEALYEEVRPSDCFAP